ncbi:MAG: hypothetical protein KAV00_07875, partial [Phycisphaerae bacterium]|nr:hypothetical protein [Phycisphaerae bacterium]
HYYVTLSPAGKFALPTMTWQGLRTVLNHSGMNVLYPEVLIEALRWLPVACALVAPVIIILCLAGRYRASNLSEWLGMLIAAVFVAFGLHGLIQATVWWFSPASGGPVLIGLFESLRIAMLPLYVLLAQATVHLLRMTHRHQAWVRVTAGLLTAVYLGSSYNTRPIRHMVTDMVAQTSKRKTFSRHRLRSEAQSELRRIASWASLSTARDALFITNKAEIRLYGRRSLLACRADLQYMLHLQPERACEWDETIIAQRRLLKPSRATQTDANKIVEFADEHRKRRRLADVPTYFLISAKSAPLPNDRLEQIDPHDKKWGKYWRLFRILPPKPTTVPAATTTTATSNS